MQAFIGYKTKITYPPSPGDVISGGRPGYHYEFTGEGSGWSSTQTLTVPDTPVSISSSATVPELPPLVAVLLIAVVTLPLTALIKKAKKRSLDKC